MDLTSLVQLLRKLHGMPASRHGGRRMSRLGQLLGDIAAFEDADGGGAARGEEADQVAPARRGRQRSKSFDLPKPAAQELPMQRAETPPPDLSQGYVGAESAGRGNPARARVAVRPPRPPQQAGGYPDPLANMSDMERYRQKLLKQAELSRTVRLALSTLNPHIVGLPKPRKHVRAPSVPSIGRHAPLLSATAQTHGVRNAMPWGCCRVTSSISLPRSSEDTIRDCKGCSTHGNLWSSTTTFAGTPQHWLSRASVGSSGAL